MVQRGEVWWADLDRPRGSEPGYARPVVIVQDDKLNESRLATVIVVIITSNLSMEMHPGNFQISPGSSGLPRTSVVNVSQMLTVNRWRLVERRGRLSNTQLEKLDRGLRRVLSL